MQVAYEVDDLHRAAHRMAALGIGPFHVVRHEPLASAVDGTGAPTNFDHVSAYGQWGGLQVELLVLGAHVPAPSLRRGPGVHHLAQFCVDLDERSRSLVAGGAPVALRAETASGVRFQMHRLPGVGHLLEIYERSEAVDRLYRFVAGSAWGWDGSDPVRELAR